MAGDEALRAKLAKVEELFQRAGSPGERASAGAAMERLSGRLGRSEAGGEADVELKFSLPDVWSVRLFVAVCRKHGVHPYRYSRQRRTTVMVRARERMFDRVVWSEFCRLHDELERYFEDVSDHLITARHALRWRRQRPGSAAATRLRLCEIRHRPFPALGVSAEPCRYSRLASRREQAACGGTKPWSVRPTAPVVPEDEHHSEWQGESSTV